MATVMAGNTSTNADTGTDVKGYMQSLGSAARQASARMGSATTAEKNAALAAISEELSRTREFLKAENEKDLGAARARGLGEALIDRLALTDTQIDKMIEGLRQVAALNDPVGEISGMSFRPSGIQVGKMRVPLGVIGIIYESRPNVTIEAASLCLKSGNTSILRGGSESIHSNRALAKVINVGLESAGLPAAAIQLVETTDREAVGELITMPEFVDVIVPRGGKSLIERISSEATIPVIKHLDGVCHVYIDDDADHNMAMEIAFNAKTSRYGVCNAMETLLIAEEVAADVLPELALRFVKAGVELRVCPRAQQILGDSVPVEIATEQDWYEEYLAAILAIRIVPDLGEAISHINTYGSQHTDSIVTSNYRHGMQFVREVDSSSVMINASPRFADGFEFGLGAEIGISTDKLHARGPVGLEGLTTQKYVVFGNGEIR